MARYGGGRVGICSGANVLIAGKDKQAHKGCPRDGVGTNRPSRCVRGMV